MDPLLTASTLLLWLLFADFLPSLFVRCQGSGGGGQFDQPPSYQPPEPPQPLPLEDGETVIASLLAPSVGVLVVVGSLGILVLLVILIVSTETRLDYRADEGCREVVTIATTPPSAFAEENMKKIYVQPPSTDLQ